MPMLVKFSKSHPENPENPFHPENPDSDKLQLKCVTSVIKKKRGCPFVKCYINCFGVALDAKYYHT